MPTEPVPAPVPEKTTCLIAGGGPAGMMLGACCWHAQA